MTSGTVSINGADLSYDEAGIGQPIVLVHGNAVDRRMWDDQMDAFSAVGRVIRYDARGFGRSSLPSHAYAHYRDLASLLTELDASPAHLVGLSMGAAIVINVALAYADRVRSLVITPGGLGGYVWPEDFRTGFSVFAEAAAAGDKRRAIELMLDFPPMVPAAAVPVLRSRIEAMASEYSWAHFLPDAPRAVALEPPAAERLQEIAVPTLVVVGECDMNAMHVQADFVAARIPGARTVRIARSGHMTNMEAPGEFNVAVLDFIQEQSAGAGR